MRATTHIHFGSITLSAVLCIGLVACARPTEKPKLRILAWVGYEEPEFIKPLEAELGAEIIIKTYVGGDQMYQLFKSAPPGTYDLVDVDAEYGQRMFNEGDLRTLESSLWRTDDTFSPFHDGAPAIVGNSVYAAIVRWGALGIVYNSDRISAADADSYALLWRPELKDKIVVFDWYLPSMGVLSRYLGNTKPYDISDAQLSQLRNRLFAIKPNVRSIHGDTGDVIRDLGTGEAWASFGIGEWAAAVLAEQGKPITWIVPKEGGVMWVEGMAIPKSATRPELSQRVIAAMRNPQNLARLAWRQAYHSQVPIKSAYQFLSPNQRRLLKAEDLGALDTLANRLSIRQLPGPTTTQADWLRVWNAFKVAK